MSFYKYVFTVVLLATSCTSEQSQSENGTPPPVSVTSAEVQARDLSDAFTVSSDVRAYERSYVAARLGGLIEAVYVEEGDDVDQGDLLAQMDTRRLELDLQSAQIALEEASDIYERNRRLIDSDAIARSDYLTSRRNFEQAQHRVDQLQLDIEFSRIKAPIQGVVTARLIEPGNSVSENERVFTVSNLDLLVVRPGVTETRLSGIKQGALVDVQIDAHPDKAFQGRIRRIFPASDAESGLFTVEVALQQDESPAEIRPGYLARIRFSGHLRQQALTLPTESITDRDGEPVVFIINEDQTGVTMTPVVVGIRRDGYAEILEGVTEGDLAAAANMDELDENAAIHVVGSFRRHSFR